MSDASNVDKKWFDRMRAARKLPSNAYVAKALDMSPSMFSLVLNGKRMMTLESAKKLAKLLDVNVTEVATRFGGELQETVRLTMAETAVAAAAADGSLLNLVGWIDDHSAVHMLQRKRPGAISLDVATPNGSAALQYRTSGTPAESLDGWIVVIAPERPIAGEEIIGRYCVVTLANGETLLRTVRQGQVEDRFNLFAPNLPPVYDAELIAFSPVIVIRPA